MIGAGLVVWAAFFSNTASSTAQERKIKTEIAKANYCETASDCIMVAQSQCPFGCYVHVNKKQAARIKNSLENYKSNCIYQCIPFVGVECVNNTCQLIQSFTLGAVENTQVPSGWYQHRMSDTHMLLTKQQELPDIGGTEGYAYGQQINIEVIKRDVPYKEWLALYVGDDALVSSKEWSTISGYEFLRVEQEAGGAAGKVLNYYVFVDDLVYIFSLYPLESYDPISEENIRNTENIKALDYLLQAFIEQLNK